MSDMTIKFKRDDTYMEMNVGITFMIASGKQQLGSCDVMQINTNRTAIGDIV